MFENLTERLNNVFTQLRRRGKLAAADVDTAMREVRLALLEADVNYGVVKDFITESVTVRLVQKYLDATFCPKKKLLFNVNKCI